MRNSTALSSSTPAGKSVLNHDEAKFGKELQRDLKAIGPSEAISRFLSNYASTIAYGPLTYVQMPLHLGPKAQTPDALAKNGQ